VVLEPLSVGQQPHRVLPVEAGRLPWPAEMGESPTGIVSSDPQAHRNAHSVSVDVHAQFVAPGTETDPGGHAAPEKQVGARSRHWHPALVWYGPPQPESEQLCTLEKVGQSTTGHGGGEPATRAIATLVNTGVAQTMPAPAPIFFSALRREIPLSMSSGMLQPPRDRSTLKTGVRPQAR
jgi:hypothetical protein